MYVGNRYIGCICRYTYTTLCYIRRKIFGGIENCYLSLPMKKNSEPAIAMTTHALFLAMDNFFRWIVNFSEQCLVRKVAVANFATIAERQIALPWRLRPSPPPTYPTAQEWADSLWFDPTRSDNWCTPPKVCAWNSQPDEHSIANPIGVRVWTRLLHWHRCLYSSVTLVAAIDPPTS